VSGDPTARYNWLKVAAFAVIILVIAQINDWRLLDKLFLTLLALLAISWLWSWSSLRGLRIERRAGLIARRWDKRSTSACASRT